MSVYMRRDEVLRVRSIAIRRPHINHRRSGPPLATDIATGLNLCSHLFGDMNANGEHGSSYLKGHRRSPCERVQRQQECRGALPDYLLSVTRILPALGQATGL